ncbi:MAG: ADP-forming succinate--CoA ligase subunit beta [Nitrososphaerota archaeon]
MKLLEHEGLRLLSEAGIPVPSFIVVKSPEEAERAASRIGLPVVLKAQVLVGGRGKAGGVKVVESLEAARRVASELLGSRIRGEIVEELLVAEVVEHVEELYLSIIVDRASNSHLVLASRMGGIDVEELSKNHPEALVRVSIDPLTGLRDWHTRIILKRLGLSSPAGDRLRGIIKSLYNVYTHYNCDLAEINPLSLKSDGELVALDAKVIVDDNAARVRGLKLGREVGAESEASKLGLNYVELDGEIGIVCNGAGLTMATMDLVNSLGGRPACFLDLGGGATAELVYKALKLLSERPHVKVVFLNVLAGITRCDEVAAGVVRIYDELGGAKKIVVRLVGTNEDEGRRILESRGISYFTRMLDAAQEAVKLAS